MAKILVVYYSRGGNTRRMAELVARGAEEAGGEVTITEVARVSPEELLKYEGIIVGSPTYYGLPAWEIKKLLDESVKFHGKLNGRVGGAFASAANVGGGNETTIMAILNALLIHGMIIQGTPYGDHYGPVSINKPDARVEKQCLELGRRVAGLAEKLCG